jgi:hypothetical protein
MILKKGGINMNKSSLILAVMISMFLTIAVVDKVSPVVYKTMHYGNLGAVVYYHVIAPVDVKIGEDFSVDINFSIQEDILAYTFYIWIHGAGTSWEETIADNGEVVSAGTILRTATIKATEMGAVWCSINLGFYDSGDNWYSGSSSFGICMPRDKTYNELQSDYSQLKTTYDNLDVTYESLQNDYDSLQADYDSLDSNYNDLQTNHNSLESSYDSLSSEISYIRNLMYVFLATTIVFIVATLYFAVRKPRVMPSNISEA